MKKIDLSFRMRVTIALVAVALTACATSPPENPWQTVNRGYHVESEKEAMELNALMQPCMDYARKEFPQAANLFKAGLSRDTHLVVESFTDAKRNFYIEVTGIDGDRINGRINGKHVVVKGHEYAHGDKYGLTTAEIVDWLIVYPDRPEEGNWLGRYLLLRQDDLISGACNPHDAEFQHFRFFALEYSFVPPDPKGWSVPKKGTEGMDLAMEQEGKGPHEHNAVYSNHRRVPVFQTEQEMIDFFTVPRDDFGNPDRYTLLTRELGVYPGHQTKCLRSHQVVEDKQALFSDKTRERGLMNVEHLQLVCVHPRIETMAVAITYVHSYEPDQRDLQVDEKVDAMFESLAFRMHD